MSEGSDESGASAESDASDDGRSPDPYEIRNAGEFIAALSALKDWSGLTYRELTARADAVGDVLPRSTVANMLARTTLPREELVAAYARACGCGPGTVEHWLKVRKELAVRGTREAAAGRADAGSGDMDAPGEAAGTDPGRARRRWPVVVAVPVALVLMAVAVAVGLFAWNGDGGDDARSSGPVAGERMVRVGGSSLCLTERAGSSGHLCQGPCKGAIPRFTLVPRGGDTWRIATLHPEYGEGCMGVQRSARHTPAPLENDYCGKRGKAETFRLEPVGRPVEGYRIRPLHTGFCLGVEDGGSGGSDKLWAEVVQTTCAADAERQIFRFEPPDPSGPPVSAPAARNG
ncbi:RICIN domain-containing protein [Streptomyces sp. ISL-100]|uniref:RICIN domain-containing protein n=1 Tax=Streptomyces sp. ISL-100 TaxID=2819173 RepID=UPI001BE9C9BB|nr:RICIN domain-containing protein [Streptomyces sp. ISL-100]MBT2401769.1 hypothetical protein [Streptomyces sp. ISL-100]